MNVFKGNARERRAVTAAAALCYRGFVDIRVTAYRASQEPLPTGALLIETLERIRRLADTCHNLPMGLDAHQRRRPVTGSLQVLWDTSGEEARGWIREVLTDEGLDIDDIVNTNSPVDNG